jgi:hypothetical protein
MNANASDAAKVLPIAKNPIKKTGRFRTKADAIGNNATGLHPPRRLRNQNKDGAYANEKSSAAMMSETIVAPLMSAADSVSPSTRRNVSRIAVNPTSQEPKEMEMSFMVKFRIADCGFRLVMISQVTKERAL